MKEQVQTLCEQHDELRALADEYEAELAKPAPDLAALSGCRWKLARLVSTHLAYERMYLYGTLHSRGDGSGAQLGAQLTALGDKLSAHVRDWTPAAITTDWRGYGKASKGLMTILRKHMDREESDLYPLLLKAKAA
jgi:hypothetical protein